MVSQEFIRVTVRRTANGTEQECSLDLELSPSQTVGETKELVRRKDATFPIDQLTLDGKEVEDATVLSTFLDSKDETLVFTAERRTLQVSAAPVKRRKRCSFTNCTSAPLRGVGDCGLCEGRFCSRHRLMEQHKCTGLQNCKDTLRERNALKLAEQQTVAHKV